MFLAFYVLGILCPWHSMSLAFYVLGILCSWHSMSRLTGKTGVTADRDKIEFRVILKIELELNNLNSILSRSAVTPVFPLTTSVACKKLRLVLISTPWQP